MESRFRRPSDSTRARFLDAAERMFIEEGYTGTKIRAIAKLSESNLGVLSHYWGTKRALFRDLFEQRLKPIHDDREKRLAAIEKQLAAGKTVTLARLLRAQIEPALLVPGTKSQHAARVRLLYGRALTDPSDEVVEAMGEIFSRSSEQFFLLLRRLAPDMEQTEFYWRANCVVGALVFAESYTERLTRFIDEDMSTIDWIKATDYVIDFVTIGMSAPVSARKLSRPRSKSRHPRAKSRR